MTEIKESIDRRNEKTEIERGRVKSAEEIVREWQRMRKIDFESQKKEEKRKFKRILKKNEKEKKEISDWEIKKIGIYGDFYLLNRIKWGKIEISETINWEERKKEKKRCNETPKENGESLEMKTWDVHSLPRWNQCEIETFDKMKA